MTTTARSLKRTLLLLLAFSIARAPAVARAESPAERDRRMAWFREARFGMFIHWGVYSVPAGTYRGKQIRGIGEWIMNSGRIPVAEYRDYARMFNPTQFDADAWVRTAKDAGVKYIVITSKHHDGFAMFDSKASGWNIVKASPFGRDPLKELAAACKKHGIQLGFYYSQAQDWNNPGGAGAGWDTAQAGDMTEYIRKVAAPQVRELLTNYGRVSVLWWDTPQDMTRERADLLLPLLKLQPGIIQNNRLGGGYDGDTNTPEQFIPPNGYPGRDWETCMTMNDTWGYKSYDDNWKSTEVLVRQLIDAASKGGNYLLNVGPTSEGLIPAPSVERLRGIGKWLRTNGPGIYGTTANPFRRLPWGRSTKKIAAGRTTLYLHVFDWPKDGKLVVPGLRNKARAAHVLGAAGNKSVPTETTAVGMVISVPPGAADPISTTVAVDLEGRLEIDPVGVFQDFDGTVIMSADEARLHGSEIRYESGDDAIARWTTSQDWPTWQLNVSKTGRFVVSADIAATGPAAGEIWIGDARALVKFPTGGNFGKFNLGKLGEIEIPTKGKVEVSLRPVKDGWHAVSLRSLVLSPHDGGGH